MVTVFLLGIYIIIKVLKKTTSVIRGWKRTFLRMTGGNLTYEFTKYEVLILYLWGCFIKGFQRSCPILAFPIASGSCVVMTGFVLDYSISKFDCNISGPVCLAFSSLYTYRRKVVLG
jgi:hypothetical protein